jgi:transcriptional regulator with XRE-family HTH domain
MNVQNLRGARLKLGWTQQTSARRLRVSQSYISMLEGGARQLTRRVATKMMRVYSLSSSVLPPAMEPSRTSPMTAERLVDELGALGYPGFAYLRKGAPTRNPQQVVLEALAQRNLEARVVEALPWVMARHADTDTRWLEDHAKLQEVQNRLGFVVTMARRATESDPRRKAATQALARLEERLYRSRLAREDTLCQQALTGAERRWLCKNRSEEARRWNLLTPWRPEHFRYAQDA